MMLAKVFMHMSLVGCHVLWLLWCQNRCLVSQNCDSYVVLPDLWTFGNRSYMWQVKSEEYVGTYLWFQPCIAESHVAGKV